MPHLFRKSSRVSRPPRRPYERERLDHEIQLVGEYGLRNKRELWRVHYTLAHLRKVARDLLTLDPKDPRRRFEGDALIRRLQAMSILTPEQSTLEFVLGLQARDLLDRRLQTFITRQQKLATTIHEARTLIHQRHIAVGDQLVNIPSFMVRADSGRHVQFHVTSTLAPNTDRLGRIKRRKRKAGQAQAETE